MNKTEQIIEETQRESIINRPYNLAGSIKRVKKERFNITQDNISFSLSSTVPALIKLFMESLDNPIDVAIKGGCDIIDIKVDNKSIRVKDNGYGVSTEMQGDESVLYKAFCKYNTSSNYQDKKGQGQKGVNGIGIKLCTTLSTLFEVTSEDINGKLKITATENNLNHKIKELKKTGKTGVEVYFEPDFNIFEINEIDEEHINKMYEYTLMQALTYPDIKFKFNGKNVKIKPKQFISLLSENAVILEEEKYFIAVLPSESGEFRQLSYINGLEISKGGSHIDYVMDNIVRNLRGKIQKKYKSIKPSDIKNKLNIVIIGRDMKHIDWEGQVKDTIASTSANIREYFKDIDLVKFSDKVYRNKAITEGIIDYFRIAEEFKKKQELKGLNKTKKKIKSEKYTRAVGIPKMLFIAEGDSAANSVAKIMGRDGNAFYALKGKPLNSYSASQSKFTSNKELTELYQIVQSENWEKIVITSDSDLDGFAINGLLFGFFFRYLGSYLRENKIYRLNTPVAISKKGKKITDWVYDFDKIADLSGDVKYLKGLGSLTTEILETVIKKDGFDNMLMQFQYTEDSEESIDDWYSGDKADKRKTMVQNNNFSIIIKL